MATLQEIGADYRASVDAIRHRIQLVEELPARSETEKLVKAERLRMLEAMYRDVREMAVICERYYDRRHRRNERYVL